MHFLEFRKSRIYGLSYTRVPCAAAADRPGPGGGGVMLCVYRA